MIGTQKAVQALRKNGGGAIVITSSTAGNAASAVSANAYRCTCKIGFTNGMCGYKFIKEYDATCKISESSASKTHSGNCDVDLNECQSSPCKNGADCTDSSKDGKIAPHAYRCSCTAGFANGMCVYKFIAQYAAKCNVTEGGNCDVDVNECASSPCRVGAVCTDSSKKSSVPIF